MGKKVFYVKAIVDKQRKFVGFILAKNLYVLSQKVKRYRKLGYNSTGKFFRVKNIGIRVIQRD